MLEFKMNRNFTQVVRDQLDSKLSKHELINPQLAIDAID